MTIINEISTVGIVGAGQMGNGIAHVCAVSGYAVIVQDVKEEQLELAKSKIAKNLERQVKKGHLTQEHASDAVSNISYTTDSAEFGQCEMIIEAATENEAVKSQIFSGLLPHLNDTAILATNTSSLSITRLAAQTDRPDRFMGIHFMNPVPVMELVELIRGIGTSKETFKTCEQFVQRLGKQTAVSEDFPAFIVNRVLIPMINEAVYTLYGPCTHEGGQKRQDFQESGVARFMRSIVATPTLKCRAMVRMDWLMVSFKGAQYPKDVILFAVFFYVRYDSVILRSRGDNGRTRCAG